jgi:hypothetical protein
MSKSPIAGFVGGALVLVGIAGLVVHGDAFLDFSLIGDPLARFALGPLGVTDLGGAMTKSFDGVDAGSWLIAIASASDQGELRLAYSLIDVGAESLSRQLQSAGAGARVPVLYVLKAYMYLAVTPWWMSATAAVVGSWIGSAGRGSYAR